MQPFLIRSLKRKKKKQMYTSQLEAIADKKRQQMHQRKLWAVERLKFLAFHRHALRIQRAYRNWCQNKSAAERDSQRHKLRERRLQRMMEEGNEVDDDATSQTLSQRPLGLLADDHMSAGSGSLTTVDSQGVRNKKKVPPLFNKPTDDTTSLASDATVQGTLGENGSVELESVATAQTKTTQVNDGKPTDESKMNDNTDKTNNSLTSTIKNSRANEKRRSLFLATMGVTKGSENGVPATQKVKPRRPTNSTVAALMSPIAYAKSAVQSVLNDHRIPEIDRIRLKNAILNYHSQSLVQDGKYIYLFVFLFVCVVLH